jgi:hypothetical protein
LKATIKKENLTIIVFNSLTMETVLSQIKNKKAFQLLKNLEDLKLIKMLKEIREKIRKVWHINTQALYKFGSKI